jgi:hypothetical protein
MRHLSYASAHVAIMSHGVAAYYCKSLELKGNDCNKPQHEKGPSGKAKPLFLLATPAEVSGLKKISGLVLQTCVMVQTAAQRHLCRLTNLNHLRQKSLNLVGDSSV